MTYAKEWPYYSKKNEQIHITTLSYYSSKSIFFKAGCVRSNMKNNHRILEKTAECEPYEFAKVNTIALIWQLLSSILITKFWNMFEHHVLVLHEK